MVILSTVCRLLIHSHMLLKILTGPS